jgi:uncharacterized protein involved in exopolysaccharide biosynthesis
MQGLQSRMDSLQAQRATMAERLEERERQMQDAITVLQASRAESARLLRQSSPDLRRGSPHPTSGP